MTEHAIPSNTEAFEREILIAPSGFREYGARCEDKRVVVVESPASEKQMHAILDEVNNTLSQFSDVGEYDQKLKAA